MRKSVVGLSFVFCVELALSALLYGVVSDLTYVPFLNSKRPTVVSFNNLETRGHLVLLPKAILTNEYSSPLQPLSLTSRNLLGRRKRLSSVPSRFIACICFCDSYLLPQSQNPFPTLVCFSYYVVPCSGVASASNAQAVRLNLTVLYKCKPKQAKKIKAWKNKQFALKHMYTEDGELVREVNKRIKRHNLICKKLKESNCYFQELTPEQQELIRKYEDSIGKSKKGRYNDEMNEE